jgi:hypothetical protein
MIDDKIYLSASRIKTVQQCSWTYWCKYILKLPDKSNDGASKGWICHLIFEVLGRKDRAQTLSSIVADGSIWGIPAIKRLVLGHARRLGVNTDEHLGEIDRMILNGLNYDFGGNHKAGLEKEFSEKDFRLSVDQDGIRYNIRGFIDKLFLYEDKKAIIRDFKTSKQKFKGKEITDNMQDLMYCLAVKKMFPEYKGVSEFLFLKFDLERDLLDSPGPGVIRMNDISLDALEGFEYELTEIQKYLETFNLSKATSNFAGKQNYPKDGTFGGPLACGKDGFKKCKGENLLDESGKPIKAFICAFRKPFEYYALTNKHGKVKKSVFKDNLKELDSLVCEGDTIKEKKYEGCPYWKERDRPTL